MPTTNPVPSLDPSDLLFNAGRLDQVVNGSTQYYTDRLGVNRRTMEGISAAADAVLGGIGYAPPVAYAAGISMTLTTQTVEYSGEVYAPKVGNLPFTTSGTFETAKFRLIQGVAATDLAASGGSAMVGYIPAGTGAVATTVQTKLRETVSVKDFGAVGDGVTDDTAAIQAAINTGKNVSFPAANYRITAQLTVGSQKLTGGIGDKAINRSQSIISIAGNHPCFVNGAGEISFEIDGFYIDYGDTVPTNAGTSSNKIGFYFTTNTLWPAFSKISNCTVRGAWEGYYDNTGTYQSILERVFAINCRRGFYKQNGTTIKFDTCMAQGGLQGFWIKDTLSPTLISVAADQLTPTTAENTANYFEGCRSLTILGWDAESNVISGNALSYIRFVQTVGAVTGLVGYLNTLNCSTGQEVYFIKADQGCRLNFSGCRTARNVGDLVFAGTAGVVATILAYDTTSILLSASDFVAPTGGTPTVRYSALASLVSTIKYAQTNLNSNKVGTTELADTENGTWSVGLNSYTVMGSPILTGYYTRTGKLVTCWAVLNPNGGTIASVVGTSALSGLPYTPTATTTCTVSDAAVANTGVGIVTTSALVYTPAWTASANQKTVHFSYYIG